MRGTNGCNIEKHYNVVTPQDDGKLLDHAVYTLVNPCAAALVGRARAWKGVTTARMRYGESMVVPKPAFGLWRGKNDSAPSKKRRRRRRDGRAASAIGRSVVPDEVPLVLTRPPTVGGEDGLAELDDQQLRDEVMKRVAEAEVECDERRAQSGQRVLGMGQVRKQHWTRLPGPEDMFGSQPTVSARSRWARIEALERRRGFERAYAWAREAWRQGVAGVEFPWGTWLMWRRFGAPCMDQGCAVDCS